MVFARRRVRVGYMGCGREYDAGERIGLDFGERRGGLLKGRRCWGVSLFL